MTLRSLKKHLTTVLTFLRLAKQVDIGLAAASGMLILYASLMVPAHAEEPNFNLNWRTSKRVLPQPHYVTHGDVFAEDYSMDAAPRRADRLTSPSAGTVRTAHYAEQATRQPGQSQTQTHQQRSQMRTDFGAQGSVSNPVRQAGWSEEGRFEYPNPAPQPGADHARASRDFFSNPFGKKSSDQVATQAKTRNSSRKLAQLGMPNDPTGNPIEPSNALRGGAAPPSADQVPNLKLPEPLGPAPDTTPPATKPPAGNNPDKQGIFDSLLPDRKSATEPPVKEAVEPKGEIRDFLEDGPGQPEASERQNARDAANSDNDDEDAMALPPPKRFGDSKPPAKPKPSTKRRSDDPESPSDRDEEFQNPFGRNPDRADEDDLRRLQERIERQRRENKQRAADNETQNDDEVKRTAPKVFSCDEFRERLAREDIRNVSLDISPPFRPDVFSQKEYEELKGKFDAKQFDRPWYSVDGTLLGNGRLSDLAYEKAVIQNASGSSQQIDLSRLSENDLAYISQNWGLPNQCRLQQAPYKQRMWTRTVVTWKASALCHKPLYFEEVNLERYGHTAGPILQPVVSSAHFFANIAVLPYKAGIHPPNECQYALGYYRPGDCAPWIVPPVPLSLRGAAAQLAAVTTGFWLIP